MCAVDYFIEELIIIIVYLKSRHLLKQKKFSMLHKIAFLLLIVGGLNWLLVGLFGWDIGSLFGGMSAIISRLIYILVGLSAILELFSHKKTCKDCVSGKHTGGNMGSGNMGGGM